MRCGVCGVESGCCSFGFVAGPSLAPPIPVAELNGLQRSLCLVGRGGIPTRDHRRTLNPKPPEIWGAFLDSREGSILGFPYVWKLLYEVGFYCGFDECV